MRHSSPNTSKGQVICYKRPHTDRISQLWVALLGTIVLWWSRLSGSLQNVIMGRIRKLCSVSLGGRSLWIRMKQKEKKQETRGVGILFLFKEFIFSHISQFVEFPLYFFIKMYMNNLQQRTTLKKTSKQAAKTGVNNWTHTPPSPRPTPITPPVQWDKDMSMMSHI